MSSLLSMFLVVLVIVLGLGACWAITAHGAAATSAPVHDSFGDTANSYTVKQNSLTAGIAVATMPLGLIAFIIAVCAAIVISFVWLWNTGHTKPSKY